MKKLILFSLLICSYTLAQDFRGGLDRMTGRYDIDFNLDGGIVSTTVECSAVEAFFRDGGTWPLKIQTVGPVTRVMPNGALSVCRSLLLFANRIDGGLPDGGQ